MVGFIEMDKWNIPSNICVGAGYFPKECILAFCTENFLGFDASPNEDDRNFATELIGRRIATLLLTPVSLVSSTLLLLSYDGSALLCSKPAVRVHYLLELLNQG